MRLVRDGEPEKGGEEGMEVGGMGDYIYLSLHCHNQHDFCVKVGHFTVS